MNYWIFQSVPERFDLRNEANLYEGMDGWWYATRYRRKMTPGDIVYFWMGGENDIRGIYGVGTITSEPYQDGEDHKIKIHVDKRLPQHISVTQIKNTEALNNLMILRIAIGSNFLINEAEGQSLLNLVNGGV